MPRDSPWAPNRDAILVDAVVVVPPGRRDRRPTVELNVFNAVFTEYFWDVNNAGVRVTQVLMRANF